MPVSLRTTLTVATIALTSIGVVAPAVDAGPRRRPAPVLVGPPMGSGIGLSGGSGGLRVGGGVGASPDPLLNSAATGAIVGSMGGPIGMAIGAGVGVLHGLWAKKKQEQQARADAERQRAMDRELEREMAAQRPGGPSVADSEGQGVLIVSDHLAETPSASPATPDRPTQVASVPPAEAAAPARGAVDAGGFRPVYEGTRLVRHEHRAPDGLVDVVLHYDTRGRVVRRDESSRLDGRLDTSASFIDGVLQRKDSDTDGDGTRDVWAYYDGAGELTRMESLASGGGRRTEVYRGGRVAERLEGDLLSVFDDAGRLVKQGRKGAGDRMLAWRYFEANGDVTKEEEFDTDGGLSAVAHYERGRLVRRELYEVDESAFTRVPLVAPETKVR
jgi:hypothetical protein